MEYKFTHKPRELYDSEIDQLDLRYYGGEVKTYIFETTGNPWTVVDNGKLPVYRFYDGGTNCARIIVYNWDTDSWTLDRLEGGYLWLLLIKLASIGFKYSDREVE